MQELNEDQTLTPMSSPEPEAPEEASEVSSDSEVLLPSGRVAECDEWTGEDFATLSTERLIRDGRAFDIVLARRVKVDGQSHTNDWWRQQLEADRSVAVVKGRMVSLGPSWNFKLECTNAGCREESEHQVTFKDEDLECKPYPHGTQTRIRLEFEGDVYELDLQTGEHTAKILKAPDRNLLTQLMIRRVRVFDRADDKKGRPVDFKNKTGRWIMKFVNAVREQETATTKMEVTLDCPYCGKRYRVDPTATPDFFVPNTA